MQAHPGEQTPQRFLSMESLHGKRQFINEVKIPTGRHHVLRAFHYIPEASEGRVIIINSATGVRQDFYRHFAGFLAAHGFQVYTYDYSGIGRSRPSSLRTCDTDMLQWGEVDLAAMIRYVRERHPGHRLTLLGHSVGGQLIGTTPESAHADSFILIGSQTPYWRHYAGLTRVKVWLLWHVLIPTFSAVWGYFPARRLGLFEDLPRNAARQWARWGKSRRYMFDEYPSKRGAFAALRQPALAISFSDDSFAPPRAVEDLLRHYRNLDLRHSHYRPRDVNLRSIGHFRFFRKDAENVFWNDILQFVSAPARHPHGLTRAPV